MIHSCVRREKRERTAQLRADTRAAREAKKREGKEELASRCDTQEAKTIEVAIVVMEEGTVEKGEEVGIPEEVIENNANAEHGGNGSGIDVEYDES